MLKESPQKRGGLRRSLSTMDMSPWHDFHGVSVWRNGLHEYKCALGQQIMLRGASIDAAIDFIMANGFEV